ncbi:hypothetical protein DSM106972_071660 [Dulcicalothrix desertica PCC 7102]|uniref:NB-ARC domain-containing protein n=1 Tax=Dulcicalothrix desertica PCC 7102 TaxID=232991 RepID=A0A3S1IQK5_9CYAN|nr:NB-ARC domain-containing protein [Dulcicalothrix desertica]RUT00757.1 hypothetical protein DSM106972_071660 [Dulcicalothrix desertica PCC 7102]TWH42400.1 WD40 repeat protein [Dulcicalothrix desertica PCC 7102]
MNRDDFDANYSHLTARQKEILNLFVARKSDNEISSVLTIEVNTVRKHISDTCQTFFGDKKRNRRIELMLLCLQYLDTSVTIPPVDAPKADNITIIYGEMPNVNCFYGRTKELSQLTTSVIENNLRCVAVVGMGGIGKTTLVAQFIHEHQAAFECIIWQDLKMPIKLIDLLKQWLIYFDAESNYDILSDSIISISSKVIEYLKTRRCLLVLDNVESIMQDGRVGSFYREYEEYGELLRRIRETTHQSCLIITSRESLNDFDFSNYPNNKQSCILKLDGLQVNDVLQLYTKLGSFNASLSEWSELTEYYGGNPLELRIVATEIQETYQGDVAQFIKEYLKFGYLSQIRDLFNAQFKRLSEYEKEIVYWLAIHSEPVTREQLQQDIVQLEAKQNLIDSIRLLRRRSFIEESANGFTLQPVLLKYARESFINQVTEEIKNQKTNLLDSHSLVKATGCDYIRNIQVNLFVQPILQRLLRHLGNQSNLEQHLQSICTSIKSEFSARSNLQAQNGYSAGNLLNLLRYLGTDLTGYDFSQMNIKQADFRNLKLKNVNFNNSNLESCLFSTQLGGVIWVVFSKSGKLLAAGDVSGNVHIWEVVQDKLIPYALLQGHDGWVWSVRFSNDEQFLASAGDEYNIRVWRLETQSVDKLLQGHTDWIRSLSFSREGILASASDDKTVKLWDINTGECICTLREHKASVRSVSFNPVGNQLASASDDETIIIWDINTKTPLQILRGHSGSIRSVCFSPDGKLVASAGSDKTVRIWNLQTGECKVLTEHSHWVRSVDFSADGKLLLSGSEDQTVKLWDVSLCKSIKTFREHTSWVQSVRFSNDGKKFASGSADRTVKLWDIEQGCLNTIEGYTNCLFSIAFNADGNILASGYEDGTIRLWNLQTLRYTTLRGHQDWVRSVIFSVDGKSLASTSADGTVRVWNVETGKSQVFQGHTSWIRQVRFSPDNRFLASCSDDCTIKIWNIETGLCVQTLTGHSGWVRSIAFDVSGNLLASAGGDGTIKLWRLDNNFKFNCIQTLEGHNDWVWWVSFSPDGILASGGGDGTVRIWRQNSNNIWVNSQILHGHTKSVRTVAFSHDGKIIASGGVDRMLRLWDTQTWSEICQPQQQNDWIRSVAFSTTGYLASASQDGTIRLLHLESYVVKIIRLPNLYEAMDIRDVRGLTDAQMQNLKALGAMVT